MGYVEDAFFHLFQQLAQVVVVERQRPDEQRVQYHAARPHVRFPAVIFLALRTGRPATKSMFIVSANARQRTAIAAERQFTRITSGHA